VRLIPGYTLAEIKAVGYVEGLKAAGIKCDEAKAAGYTLAEMRAGGFTCADAKTAGYSLAEMRAGGYKTSEECSFM
jgi:intracellular multiplication protein IcmE